MEKAEPQNSALTWGLHLLFNCLLAHVRHLQSDKAKCELWNWCQSGESAPAFHFPSSIPIYMTHFVDFWHKSQLLICFRCFRKFRGTPSIRHYQNRFPDGSKFDWFNIQSMFSAFEPNDQKRSQPAWTQEYWTRKPETGFSACLCKRFVGCGFFNACSSVQTSWYKISDGFNGKWKWNDQKWYNWAVVKCKRIIKLNIYCIRKQ